MQGWVEQFYSGVLVSMWPALKALPVWPLYIVVILVGAAIMLGWLSFMGIVGTYGERRIAGFIQVRLGPNRVGPFGVLQPIADGLKLLGKEDIVPSIAFKSLHILAPILVLVGAFLPFAALPFSERLLVTDMPLALYYILAFEAIEVIGILMAGWAPGSKWSLYGGMRLAAQMLSYEIPMSLCLLVVAFLAGSLNFNEIVKMQEAPVLFGTVSSPWVTGILGWWIFRSPAAFVAFFIFFIGGLAASKRAPFDLPEAESELVAGYHTEYSGMRFAMFFMAEYAAMYVICAAAAIVFLGGWHGPIPRPAIPEGATLIGQWTAAIAAGAPANLPLAGKASLLVNSLIGTVWSETGFKIIANQAIGAGNLLMKAFFLYFVMIWVRWTLPRVRIDQVMYLCLKVLLPFSLACAVWAAIQVVLS
ncbi:MAG: complex I subunit 1 family protein [Candidatus Sumerlaeia bacterium]